MKRSNPNDCNDRDVSAIQRLSKPTINLIRACSVLPTFHDVAQELILNCLDAQSTKIDVYIDFLTFSIEVADNG